jgi:hypothetical protein
MSLFSRSLPAERSEVIVIAERSEVAFEYLFLPSEARRISLISMPCAFFKRRSPVVCSHTPFR